MSQAPVSDSSSEFQPGRESKASSGEIIEIWLNELEAAQPQHGPLLVSTLDVVGNLPAVSDDGSIYTVSHNKYWYAAGYAQSYAKARADSRRIDAVLAEADAKKVKDEPTMVRKEAEAEFWESIQDWVEATGPSRMKPEPVPGWLSRINPAWNPGDDT
jgi:hypothetical protein